MINTYHVERWGSQDYKVRFMTMRVHNFVSNRLILRRVFMPVFDHEMMLDRGRLEHFSKFPQAHTVMLSDLTTDDEWGSHERRVEWIAEHVQSPWNARIVMDPPLDKVTGMEFSFEDGNKGLLFKLVFA